MSPSIASSMVLRPASTASTASAIGMSTCFARAISGHLRDLPDQTWVEKPDEGYCFVHGNGNQKGTEKLGLGIAFDHAAFEKMQEIEDKNNGGRIYIFSPEKTRDGAARLASRLLAYWDSDGWISNPADFEKTLAQYGHVSKSPAKVQIASEPEMR